jgi:hypothetical protein
VKDARVSPMLHVDLRLANGTEQSLHEVAHTINLRILQQLTHHFGCMLVAHTHPRTMSQVVSPYLKVITTALLRSAVYVRMHTPVAAFLVALVVTTYVAGHGRSQGQDAAGERSSVRTTVATPASLMRSH